MTVLDAHLDRHPVSRLLGVLAAVSLVLSLAGCDGDDTSPTGAEPEVEECVGQCEDAGPTDTVADVPGPDVTWTCTDLPKPPPGGGLRLVRFAPEAFPDGANLFRATGMVPHPTDPGRWYVVRQGGGVITFVEGEPGVQLALDLTPKVWAGHHEVGLVSIALHPEFASNGHAYFIYSAPGGNEQFLSRLARYTSDDGGLTFDPDSELVILDVEQTHGSHSMNHVAFGLDGMAYVALGDGQNAGWAGMNSQKLDDLRGSMLRIDVDAPSGDLAYGIPVDNPLAGGGGRGELFAWGLRQVWRFSVDRETGAIWAGDVGRADREEIDIVVAGGNYGWPFWEGDRCRDEAMCDSQDFDEPVVVHTRGEAASITGGHVYRGSAIDWMVGQYVYGDFVYGNLWTLEVGEDGAAESSLRIETGFNISSFAEGLDGELYVVRYSAEGEGALYRLEGVDEAPDNGFPTLLSETGCVDPSDPTALSEHVVPYSVRSPLWSDGADKRRWLAVPDGAAVAVKDDGDLDLPVGTVAVKDFAYDGVLHETRLLVRHDDGWAGYSYEWNEDGTDAVLLDTGKTVELDGGLRWDYPTRGQCMRCHTDAAGRSLGLELTQLDDTTRQAFVSAGWVTQAQVDAHPPMPVPLDETTGTTGERARAYLHANCSFCHRPASPVQGDLDLRYTVPFGDMNACLEAPEHGFLWKPEGDRALIVPGKPESSLLWERMDLLNQFRMPPLASSMRDEEAVDLIGDWITGLEGCE